MAEKKERKQSNVDAGGDLRRLLTEGGFLGNTTDLAMDFGMSRGNLEKILNGTQGLNTDKFVKIFEHTRIEPNDIVLGENYRRRRPDMFVTIEPKVTSEERKRLKVNNLRIEIEAMQEGERYEMAALYMEMLISYMKAKN